MSSNVRLTDVDSSPLDEALRLETLLECAILDTEPEQTYDDLVLLASQICQTPVALVSLVDRNRQWFKARHGLPATETPRNIAFCAHAIARPDGPLLVNDTLEDPRFCHNPLVTGDPGIRFYAGAPLLAPNGQPVGTVCVVDLVPRKLQESQVEALRALSRLGTELLRERLQSKELDEAGEAQTSLELKLRWLADDAPAFGWSCRADMKCDWVNRRATEYTGRSVEQMVRLGWADLMHPEDAARLTPLFEAAFFERQALERDYRIRRRDGVYRWFHEAAAPRFRRDGRFAGYTGLALDISSHVETEEQFSERLAQLLGVEAEDAFGRNNSQSAPLLP